MHVIKVFIVKFKGHANKFYTSFQGKKQIKQK